MLIIIILFNFLKNIAQAINTLLILQNHNKVGNYLKYMCHLLSKKAIRSIMDDGSKYLYYHNLRKC